MSNSIKKSRKVSNVHPFCQYDFVLMEAQKAIEVKWHSKATGVTKTMIVMNETSHFLALYYMVVLVEVSFKKGVKKPLKIENKLWQKK